VISIQLEIDGSYSELGGTGGKVKLAPAKITLNDCLACNGCITSAGMYKIDVFI
jgi:iron only hydrogenase large subunit-like protein